MRNMVVLPVIVVLSIAAPAGYAAIIYVPADYSNIQEAIDASSNGDTIFVADGTYTGPGNRDIDFKGKAITVSSENGPETTIIDCEGLGRAFYFHSGETMLSVIQGFTVTNSSQIEGYIGAICCIESSPTIESNIITKNPLTGIYCNIRANPYIHRNVISENATPENGAGIYCIQSSPKVEDYIS